MISRGQKGGESMERKQAVRLSAVRQAAMEREAEEQVGLKTLVLLAQGT